MYMLLGFLVQYDRSPEAKTSKKVRHSTAKDRELQAHTRTEPVVVKSLAAGLGDPEVSGKRSQVHDPPTTDSDVLI